MLRYKRRSFNKPRHFAYPFYIKQYEGINNNGISINCIFLASSCGFFHTVRINIIKFSAVLIRIYQAFGNKVPLFSSVVYLGFNQLFKIVICYFRRSLL